MTDETAGALRNIHAGEIAWIVGKGPSLVYLRKEHFGPGPVITINQSILVVQDFGLVNPLYSMQKDGCLDKSSCPRCSEQQRTMLYPKPGVTLLLQKHDGEILFSQECLPDHPRRVLIDPVHDLGFERSDVMSIRMCAALARLMGCRAIRFVCCDSLANGDTRRLDVLSGEVIQDDGTLNYLPNNPLLLEDLGDFPYSLITP